MKQIEQNDFDTIIELIYRSKEKVFAKINSELLTLYWDVGHYISVKTTKENWGKSIVSELAVYIKQKDPTIKGFSDKNLWRMKQFYETYHENEKLSTVLRELPQNVEGVFRDSYIFDFLDISTQHQEKDLQKALIASFKEFILELGVGFTFVGEEYRVQVGNEDFYIDLLFFHRYLRCLVAFELKVGKFKPSDLGQLEFYLEALDRDVKLEDENPSIGVLLCREKNDEVVEYALSRSLSPTVISEYETQLIPKKILQKKLHELYEQYEKSQS